MNNEYDLPEILAGIILTLTENPEISTITFDDFYDFVGISNAYRTDFGTFALINQARILVENCK